MSELIAFEVEFHVEKSISQLLKKVSETNRHVQNYEVHTEKWKLNQLGLVNQCGCVKQGKAKLRLFIYADDSR